MCLQVQKLYLATGNDRLKLLVLFSGEEDERLRKAAAGTLAMLTAEQPELCPRIPDTVSRSLQQAPASPHLLQLNTIFKNSVLAHRSLCCTFSSDNPVAGDLSGTAAQ